ncbi:SHOCT domain-containing protein [Dehalogenimonas sp. THU2]|uniref:SHOCT domain-containing protein n=1 Tax=Dehalogenimonas sp. THU2 TaxID=3151121 RepID=UPI0032188B34
MMIIGLVLAVVVIWLIISSVQKGSSFTLGGSEKKTPLEIARERYAKGEITSEEFESIKKNLS